MITLNCIIIDDEPFAHKVLQNHISQTPELNLCGEFLNAETALQFLDKNTVDLIFLDINMPQISGFDLLNVLPYRPSVIITTAYSEHAVTGFEFDVDDFLMKPIRLERFSAAISKILKKREKPQKNQSTKDFFEVKTESKTINIPTSEIYYFQSNGNYVKLITKSKNYIISASTVSLEKELNNEDFVRVHKSYIVNIKLSKIENDKVIVGGIHPIPIGKTYKMLLLTKIG